MRSIRTTVASRITGSCAFLGLFAILLAATGAPRFPQQAQSPAAQLSLAVEPAQSKVHWVLDTTLHTVHGTFALKRGELRFEPDLSKASGEIVVDATSGVSGNDSRDKKMHKEILESSRFSEIVFHPDRIDGKVSLQGASDVQVHGVFSLHGSDHELTLPIHAEVSGTSWKGTGKFSVPYIQWGLKNPSNFLLKVKPDVEIDLELSGTLQNSQVN